LGGNTTGEWQYAYKKIWSPFSLIKDTNILDEKQSRDYNLDTYSNISNYIFMTIRQIISMFEQVNTNLF